jgi:hypothetical protein
MITDQDVTKLKKTFLTRKDAEKFATKDSLADLSLEVGELHDKFDDFLIKFDFVAGAIADIREDNAFWSTLLFRHSNQIAHIAAHIGIEDLPQD